MKVLIIASLVLLLSISMQVSAACLNSCNKVYGKGLCIRNNCVCTKGYYGSDCSAKNCSSSCNNGACNNQTGSCVCNAGWTGSNCTQQIQCPKVRYNPSAQPYAVVCGGEDNGVCNSTTGKCQCNDAFFGDRCEYDNYHTPCPYDCKGTNGNGAGVCNNQTGECTCAKGFYGAGCGLVIPQNATNNCSNNCSGNGICYYNAQVNQLKCICNYDNVLGYWEGPSCSNKVNTSSWPCQYAYNGNQNYYYQVEPYVNKYQHYGIRNMGYGCMVAQGTIPDGEKCNSDWQCQSYSCSTAYSRCDGGYGFSSNYTKVSGGYQYQDPTNNTRSWISPQYCLDVTKCKVQK